MLRDGPAIGSAAPAPRRALASDPAAAVLRITRMDNANLTCLADSEGPGMAGPASAAALPSGHPVRYRGGGAAGAEGSAKVAGNTERGAGMTDRTEALAEQTRLLIAVRDRRDREAFAALFAHYAPRLKAMLRRGAMRDSEAEEVVQEAMLAVWHKAAQFDPGRASASAWIYRIARNRQIDIFRREGRPVPDELTQAPPPEPDASDALAFDQEARRLRAALDALPPEQRDMVERAYLGELSHSEIACDTGLPLGTIKSRIRLALERLRHELKDLRQT